MEKKETEKKTDTKKLVSLIFGEGYVPKDWTEQDEFDYQLLMGTCN